MSFSPTFRHDIRRSGPHRLPVDGAASPGSECRHTGKFVEDLGESCEILDVVRSGALGVARYARNLQVVR